ncbi:MAG TPA: winged helix DNA-binding domain-containing protein [Cyclobacteriaceae bacterium]|nr:winged helix DNA-binding domain-containing protein [Cyclobacteriaceae bacterium]
MKPRELLRTRLSVQKLDTPGFNTPADMVRQFGAVQAQDYYGALWAVGQRVVDATEASVEAALTEGSIIRSWPMRGTLHFVAPEDIRWIIDLVDSRVATKILPHQREVGLSKKDFVKSRSIIEKEMAGGKVLERQELYDILERNKIKTGNTRGLHITGQLAREKVICFGPKKGKQSTFVLLDEWVPKDKAFTPDEPLAELASRYFISHGPTTTHDFSWWAGLTVTEAGRALDMIKSQLKNIGDYWMGRDAEPTTAKNIVRLLPAYDEFLVAYSKTRTSETQAIFRPNVIINGEVVGTWQRAITNKGVTLKAKQSSAGVRKEMKRYAKFIDKKLLNL